MRERRRVYELMLIVNPMRSTEEDLQAMLGRLAQTVNSLGGEMVDTNYGPPWGRRKLAYPIREYLEGEASRRNFNEGFYVLIHFALASTRIPEVERTLKYTDNVMRYLITLPEASPAPVEQALEEQEPVEES